MKTHFHRSLLTGITLALLATGMVPLSAAPPHLVKDIAPGPPRPVNSIAQLRALGETVFFTASDGYHGTGLYKTIGTAAGTIMLKDINPGSATSLPNNLTVVGSTLYFTASDGTNGSELWKSDGTTAGTVLLKDIYPGLDGTSPRVCL